jgi:hypothetical protein
MILILPLLIGCAYVNDSRLYSIQPLMPQEKAQQISKVFEKKLESDGLTLKTRYHDTFPEDVAVTALEIPRRPEEKRRYPMLIILVKDGNAIQLKHSEWWLRAFSEKYRPEDYINKISPELVSTVKKELGLEIEIIPTSKELN